MESTPFTKANGGNSTEVELHRESRSTRNHLIPEGQQREQPEIPQSVQSPRGDFTNPSQAASSQHAPRTTRSLPTSIIRDPAHNDDIPFKRLTAQALQELDIQRPGHSSLVRRRRINQPSFITSLGPSVAAPSNGPALDIFGADDLPARDLINRNQAQSTAPTIASTYNEADHDTPSYQLIDHQDSYLAHHDSEMHILERDGHDLDYVSWQRHSEHELALWGNDLAGVGEHLADYIHPGNAGGDDRIVE